LPETIHDIQNQVEHHRSRTFPQEYLAFLKRPEHSTHSTHSTRCRLLRAGALSLAHAGAQFRRQISVGLTMTSTVPPDGASLHRDPGTSCLATISLSLRDKSHSCIEAPHNYLNLYGVKPRVGVWRHVPIPPRRRPSSFVLGWGSRRFARMEEEYMEKASGGTFARTTRRGRRR
jgi:hypothetical protein